MTEEHIPRLYLIEILHQTTTIFSYSCQYAGCILLKFYIKPQLIAVPLPWMACCILLKFYIKPQQSPMIIVVQRSCILLKFYIKPQRVWVYVVRVGVVSY